MGFVSVDDTWMHKYIPETTEQSKQWIFPGQLAPKKSKTVPSARKIMTTMFSYSQGVNLIDYLQKKGTITDPIRCSIEGEPTSFAVEKVLFHHDNAPLHSFRIVVSKWNEFNRYSTDLGDIFSYFQN